MRQILSLILLLFLPLAALADGMVIPTIAYPARVTIPDQRALICFSNGIERLVIETRFTGSGTNFAWVVPLPSQPVIEEATTGLFPTLEYLFRPQIIHDVPHYYVGILLAIGLTLLGRFLMRHTSLGFIIFLIVLFGFLALLLLPALSAAGRKGMITSTSAQNVSILNRNIVGIYETTTLASHEEGALQTWLSKNGYVVPTNSAPVIADYVKDGWVFVAVKVRRENAASNSSTPHPLSFTFKTDKPIYPMRLTAMSRRKLKLELYVFGPARAEAAHFTVARCTRLNYPNLPSAGLGGWRSLLYWRSWSPEPPDIVQPLLRKWANDLPVATKLAGTLSSDEMRQDVKLVWTPYHKTKSRWFSHPAALTTALNWGAGLFAAGLLVVCSVVFFNEAQKSKLPRWAGMVALVSLGFAGLIYLCLPKMKVRLEKAPPGQMGNTLGFLGMAVSQAAGLHASAADVRALAKKMLTSGNTNTLFWSYWVSEIGWTNVRNDYLGGPIHEEDSPGNYTICETNGQLEFISYDAEGAEHIQIIGK